MKMMKHSMIKILMKIKIFNFKNACYLYKSFSKATKIYLLLGVNHQGPATPPGDENGVLRGQLVLGKSIRVPLSDLERIGQNRDDGHSRGHRNLQLYAAIGPQFYKFVAVGAGKGAVVRHTGGGHKDVTHHVTDLLVEVLKHDGW